MKSLLKMLILLFLYQISFTSLGQAVMDEYMLKQKATQLEILNTMGADKPMNALESFRLSTKGYATYFSYWYQLITAAGMEDYYRSDDFIVNFYVLDERFEQLPEDLRKRMIDPKNKEKIQKFLKHYLCISEPYETFVDFAEVGNINNLNGENINIKYQVVPVPESDKRRSLSDIAIKTATANKVKFGLPFKVTNGYCILLYDFFPGTLDYFK